MYTFIPGNMVFYKSISMYNNQRDSLPHSVEAMLDNCVWSLQLSLLGYCRNHSYERLAGKKHGRENCQFKGSMYFYQATNDIVLCRIQSSKR